MTVLSNLTVAFPSFVSSKCASKQGDSCAVTPEKPLRRSITLSLDPLLGYRQEERLYFLNRQRNSHVLVVKRKVRSSVRSFAGGADLNLAGLCLGLVPQVQ